ncbi:MULTISPECIES: CoB--CoM heterodisulfide reductase iron-sulfur subunit A family protein [Thermodesulfovibrio]|jgi:quinone-modifying oxidoreductase subunit QmoA|uniref:CoB--CoM heterodisulfide reductase iron-sulfur subunit A 2 n=2 Tax=Thermodesulfovibrio yellowstonii TaxID=28262 RepID=B5YHN6_THEYD|nr:MULTISPECIES: CoB--CoM heterodisulfide reductase iron-sulfur subunit A family protein [Thermodesulfovibrio]ACI21394.1 CoB--CoM heterodisulfide reductase iron-sulfur subunit A 2 [Thermodesulfovibrio yellowstonii DSM 11347]MDI6865688.1 CoB--CoM heterodisulfide reductase iron-sulfur subunit A family protein [Thermodesulfovibrio yellowstonii]GLI52799.1 heterodisulfide reductase subunit A [Thermodesulfovibrio islandicus]
MSAETNRILVIGGGFSGLTAGIEAAETGAEVIIVEKNPYLGGRVAQLNKYFPKICPPLCGLEINFRRIKVNPSVTFYTMAEVESISGNPGDYTVKIKLNPRYVNENCTACNACAEVCPVEKDSDFNFGLNKTKAIYLPFEQSFPLRYVVDRTACPKDCPAPCVEACKYNAIDLNMQPETIEVKVDSIVVATGWKPYDATKIDNLNFGKVKNVITNMMLERLASKNGPTGGQILRPSDGKPVEKIAFVQCAGSRDENHLPFCSYICCLASLKHTLYIKEQNPDAEVNIFYIDIRTPGRYEKFFNQVKEQSGVNLIKGKVAAVEQDKDSDDVIVTAEDMLNGEKIRKKVDMVVLATGMQPEGIEIKVPGLKYAIDGFVVDAEGIYSAGCAKAPMDVAGCGKDATSAALKAIQTGVRR